MQPPKQQKMTTEPHRSKMTKPEPKPLPEPVNKADKSDERNVLVMTLRPIRLDGKEPKTYNEGVALLLTEDEADQFCDTPVEGFFSHSGTVSTAEKQKIYRAQRL